MVQSLDFFVFRPQKIAVTGYMFFPFISNVSENREFDFSDLYLRKILVVPEIELDTMIISD